MAIQRNYILSHIHLDTQPLRHSVLVFRSEVLAKVFISLDYYYSEAAKCAYTTAWKIVDPYWLESPVGRWKQPSFAKPRLQVYKSSIKTLRGNVWLFAQAYTTLRWFCNKSH